MVSEKTHRGRITEWRRHDDPLAKGLGYIIVGLFVDHERFAGRRGFTSYIVAHEGNEVETRNSRYTLEGPPTDDK